MTDDLVRRAQVRFYTSSIGPPGFSPNPTWQFEVLQSPFRGLILELPHSPQLAKHTVLSRLFQDWAAGGTSHAVLVRLTRDEFLGWRISAVFDAEGVS